MILTGRGSKDQSSAWTVGCKTEPERQGKAAKGLAAEGDLTDCQTTLPGRLELGGVWVSDGEAHTLTRPASLGTPLALYLNLNFMLGP